MWTRKEGFRKTLILSRKGQDLGTEGLGSSHTSAAPMHARHPENQFRHPEMTESSSEGLHWKRIKDLVLLVGSLTYTTAEKCFPASRGLVVNDQSTGQAELSGDESKDSGTHPPGFAPGPAHTTRGPGPILGLPVVSFLICKMEP